MSIYAAVAVVVLAWVGGFILGRYYQRKATIKDVQELMADFRALHAVADRLTDILKHVGSEEITRANEILLAEEGAEMLRELDRERGEE